MRDTAEEWLRPLHMHQSKDRARGKIEREKQFATPDLELEALLPSKEETDALISEYLDQFEQAYRIVHIPSFRREYAKFWDPLETRYSAFTALVLLMISTTSCLASQPASKLDGMMSGSYNRAVGWIKACEDWLERQSQKHRKLIHYQISCLIYLSKRVNTVKKKRFWKGAGALLQDAVSVGLHRDPTQIDDTISIYNQEMRRRIWATVQDFDAQASLDYGLPTLLSTLHIDVSPPRNLDDADFDEDTTQLPPSRPTTEYTYSSYQHLSRQSLPLRLQLSRFLTGPQGDVDYDQVIRYTSEISQEIDLLPSWNLDGSEPDCPRKPLLAYTLLHIQLRQYVIPLHQPYLRLPRTNSAYQYSEIIYYNAVRDMVLLQDKLAQHGIRTLNFLREDALTLAINLCSVTMRQPRGTPPFQTSDMIPTKHFPAESTNMIMANSQHTIQLLEKCLAMKEDRILRCGNIEPWGYSIMCCAVGLLEAHLGKKTAEAAKVASAERFVNLHYKLFAGQDPPSAQQYEQSRNGVLPQPEFLVCSKSATPFPSASQGSASQGSAAQVDVPGTPWWLPSADPGIQPINPDFNLELLGWNLNELWGADQWGWDTQ
jgi:hypothetical protein